MVRISGRVINDEVDALNLFYQEPDEDRWLPFDRYPRKIARRFLHGRPRPGGHRRVFLNLCAGLDRIGVSYRVNDFRRARANRKQLACIIGKPCVLDQFEWQNPILFGAAGYSHPLDDPNLFDRLPVRKVLVPSPWMKEMCEPYWGDRVEVWPVGIDTERWKPVPAAGEQIDVLLYDKVMWNRDPNRSLLLDPIRTALKKRGYSVIELRYGSYEEEQFLKELKRCRAMIFLCEHETQGIAYQQALSTGVPIFAWDSGGPWLDPAYYPEKVNFEPVSSVPYWDERCGSKFSSAAEFCSEWDLFWEKVVDNRFDPRAYVLGNLTLEKCARRYVEIAKTVTG